MKLHGRVALVTGASRGIGAGIARCMAREGAVIVVNYFKSGEAAQLVVKEIEAAGGSALAVKADVGDYSQVEQMVGQTIAAFGKVDILVSNAGIPSPHKPLIEMTHEEFTEVINNHLVGAYNCAHNVLPYMRKHERGDIQFISSRVTDLHPLNTTAYAAAKAGIDALTKCLAKEERYHGIRVNAIAPGMIETDMTRDSLLPRMAGTGNIEEIRKNIPFGGFPEPDDIGNLCVFLASEGGRRISGEVIYVRGAAGAEPGSFYFSGPR